jgi:chromosome segregation ATPase
MKTWLSSMFTLVILVVGVPCLAQTQDSSASAPAAAKPTPAPGATAKTTTATADKKKPKKVWTNDNVSSIPGGVSVVGEGNQSDSSQGVSGAPQKDLSGAAEARQKQIDGYRDQIRQMQAQIDAADKRIAQLKNFKAEDTSPSGGIKMNQGYNMVPLEDQVKQLEDKKKQLQAKIEDVENEARKNGIDSGDLR